jgi:hypothetical protein
MPVYFVLILFVMHGEVRNTVKKYAAVWNQNLYIGEYSGISSLKLKNSGI